MENSILSYRVGMHIKTLSCCKMKAFFLILYCILLFFSCKLSNNVNEIIPSDSAQLIKKSNSKIDTINSVDSPKQYIYLTFDDGPQLGTLDCARVCKNESISATFFIVGLHALRDKNAKQTVKSLQQQAPFFLVANHSYTHAFRNHFYTFYKDANGAFQDFIRCQDSLQFSNMYIRLPGSPSWNGGSLHSVVKRTKAIVKKLDTAGYIIVGWDDEWRFKNGNAPIETSEQMLRKVDFMLQSNRTKTKNHIVILAHDRMFHNSENQFKLILFIRGLKQHKNYVFQTIDKYPFTAKRK